MPAAKAGASIQISLKDRYLKVFDEGREVTRYPVAIGAPESHTLPGQYAITRKEEAPVYHKNGKVLAPGPTNPVGVRCMAYFQVGSGEYAIHGTAWPNWVKVDDVIKAFNKVTVGTPVIVTSH